MNPVPISVSVIGHNEANYLPEFFESLKWADEVVFVDCESTDNSLELAKKFATKVFSRPNLENLNINKTYGIDNTSNTWVMYLDPDEIIPSETVEWILEEIQNPKHDAYLFPRKNHLLGKWLKHGSQYPDYQLRLFRKDKARFPNKHVHEKLEVSGTIGKSLFPMLHYSYPTVESLVRKLNFYSSFEAKNMADDPARKASALNYIFLKPIFRSFKRYFIKGGILDGLPGFIAVFFDAVSYPIRYFKFVQLRKRKS